MDRAQFMEQLEKLLFDIPEEERREALDYYESYFDDAGPEHEADVIRELGSPGKVAAIIKADLKGNYDYTQERDIEYPMKKYRGRHKRNKSNVILLIILLVFASPFILGAAGGLFGVLVTIVVVPFSLLIALGAVVLGLLVGGITCVGAGIGILFVQPAGGILSIGIGLFLAAVAIALLVLLVWIAGSVLPWLLRKFTNLCHRLLNNRRKGGVNV